MTTWMSGILFHKASQNRMVFRVSAGKIKRPELETMQYFVKGVTNKFPTN
ncbi:MAG: hypothetical protein Ct9H300mP21_01180 [Pseudomonadota bacterium]|nr:MAG: hypothetical protein Ct9H300mP21_01180 [Pseudomonadota bacterium]